MAADPPRPSRSPLAAPVVGGDLGGTPAKGIDLYIRSQPDPVRPLLEATRHFLHESAPGLTEAMKWRQPTFMQDRNRFYLDAEADHVILGFTNGADLAEDFGAVFDNVAQEVAHVRIRSVADLERPGLREAVRAAAGHRH